jgi:ATP synthase subunit 6
MKEQTRGSAANFFPLLFLLFVIIAFSNCIGLFPFAFTVTSQLAVTFTISLSFNLGFLFLGIFLHGFQFFKLFVPSGVPTVLLPLIVIIEVVSYSIRTFSLAIRLFANMMAGHTLLHILSTFSLQLIKLSCFFIIVPVVFILIVYLLELGIAFIQAYVFTILLCIYSNDSYHPSH